MRALKQQPLFPITDFDPNNYCLRDKGVNLTKDCAGCVHMKSALNECSPCMSCPKREGYWTPSETEPNKNIEIKCHAPCRFFNHWKAHINAKYGEIVK
jgi:hypothetical protein